MSTAFSRIFCNEPQNTARSTINAVKTFNQTPVKIIANFPKHTKSHISLLFFFYFLMNARSPALHKRVLRPWRVLWEEVLTHPPPHDGEEGCQAVSGSALDGKKEKKRKRKESATERRRNGVPRPSPPDKKVMDEGREASEKPTTAGRDGMSEKERNRASRLKNKCELIRPQEAFYITSALPCLNVF